jgi:soluble cytochrome b562
MSALDTMVDGMAAKLGRLVEQHRQLRAENQRLTAIAEQLGHELDVCKKANALLTEQNKVAKIARSAAPDGDDRKEEKKRLNDLVREIDKCIALLNN